MPRRPRGGASVLCVRARARARAAVTKRRAFPREYRTLQPNRYLSQIVDVDVEQRKKHHALPIRKAQAHEDHLERFKEKKDERRVIITYGVLRISFSCNVRRSTVRSLGYNGRRTRTTSFNGVEWPLRMTHDT